MQTLKYLQKFNSLHARIGARAPKVFSSVSESKHKRSLPPFTAEHHPEIVRQRSFAPISSADVSFFEKVVGKLGVLSTLNKSAESDDLIAYNVDWMGKYRGQSQTVLRPTTTEQVSEILRYCNSKSIAVSIQGGNTGLVGGSVPVFDEVILNMGRMNKIIEFDPVEGILVCEAGCILETLSEYLAERGFLMPVDLGAKGTCHIGGNVATNAGGLRLLRYGSLHGSVLGVEAVLADGTVLSNLSGLRKDNTGLSIDQLFIGSEGSLGVVTKVTILTPVKPRSVQVAIVALPTFESVQQVLVHAKSRLNEILSAFEFWDSSALTMTLSNLEHLRHPFASSTEAPFYVLIETSGSNFEHDSAKMSSFLEMLMEEGLVTDGVLAQDESQVKDFWAIRECIPEACSREGAVYKYDISLPLKVFYQLVHDMRARLKDCGLYEGEGSTTAPIHSVIGYGHVGDGNIHLNIAANTYSQKVTDAIEPFIYDWTQNQKGSISAEHGLGLMKARWLGYSKSSKSIDYMKKLKSLFDPQGILNPYKYLPGDISKQE